MGDLVDFDATLAEADGEPTTFPFVFLGQEWQLPVSPVAKDMARVRRMYMRTAELSVKQALGQITEADANTVIELAGGADLDDLLAMMIGWDFVQQWLDLDMTDAQLKKVFRYLWLLYNGQDPNKDDLGEALPPANRGQKRATAKKTSGRSSLSTGTSSRRTGKGNTTKKSAKR